MDESLGPVAVSIRREKLEDHKEHGPQYNYRVIFRTCKVNAGAGWAPCCPASFDTFIGTFILPRSDALSEYLRPLGGVVSGTGPP